ncbi:MAG: pimeloyl-CoA dehydrogenase small subunit [Betaproteobacteria bacterium]|nr:pimeloyl-CoA dehydrogenase small subunit [Betaproteobacteria bacterium]
MDFDFSDEQRMLKESIEQLINDRYGFEQRKKYLKEPAGFSRELWDQYAEMGLLGLPFEERHGGVGGGPVETMIVMEAFGRGLVLEPYLATVVMCGGLVNLGGNEAQRNAILPKIADGSLMLAFAHSEAQSRYDLADVAALAKRDADGWLLSGEKSFVAHGNCADQFIVSARIAGERNARDGIGLFLVNAKAPGVTRTSYETQDARRAARLNLDGVKVNSNDAIGDPGKALPLIERIADHTLAAVAAEAVGAMSAAHEATLEYLRTRKQFGAAIGSFQVLQHRAVDILVALEQARSMAFYATMMAGEPDPAQRSKAISAATIQIRKSGRFIGQQVVQLHGGIGMTLEYKIGHYFKRLTSMESLLGDTDHHLAALARAGGLIAAGA